MKTDVIPSLANQKRYTTSSGNSVSSVNELHTEAKEMIRHKKGISTRHLQAYLDWLVFRKRLRYEKVEGWDIYGDDEREDTVYKYRDCKTTITNRPI